MARGQGVVQIVDEISTSSSANDYISSMDDRINSILSKYNYTKKYYGKVVSVLSNQTKATVTITGQDTNMTFLNKTGEMLKVGDYVKIELSGEDMTSAFISEKFGASSIENLNGLSVGLDMSSLVNALNSIYTFINGQQKSLLATAITLKGVPTSASDSFAQMAYNILQIQGQGFYFLTVDATVTISFSWKSGSNVMYKLDSGSWLNYEKSTVLTINGANKKVYFKGLNVVTDLNNHFRIVGKAGAYGDITHLLNSKGGNMVLTTPFCCSYMFYNCVGLVRAPDLPSTTLSDSCYTYMFYGCTSLLLPPALPALTLTQNCYCKMFYGCTSLLSTPVLAAMTMTYACYACMFYDCKSLTSTPTLPALNLALACYDGMFSGCSKLVQVTTLPATILAEGCYGGMFARCTSLTAPPKLEATTMASNCYFGMFRGCTKLVSKLGNVENYLWRIPTYNTTINNPVLFMMQDTSPFSIDISVPTSGFNYYSVDDIVPVRGLCFTSRYKDSTIRFSWVRGEDVVCNIDGTGWIEYNGATIRLDENHTVLFAGKNIETSSTAHFYMTGSFDASGDITSLTNGGVGGDVALESSNCYSYMFDGCRSLHTAPDLPSTILSAHCYSYMFRNCKSLITAPDIKGTTLAYRCCYDMFRGCTSLVTPPLLPATTLAEDCYPGMFYGCTSLITAPILPATNLAAHCYDSMFQECHSLKNPPELPATTMEVSCYEDMFYECWSLEQAPVLHAKDIADRCFALMFYGCTSLSYIKLEYDGEIERQNFYSWVSGVHSSGDIYYNGPTTKRGASSIPSGWTIHSF